MPGFLKALVKNQKAGLIICCIVLVLGAMLHAIYGGRGWLAVSALALALAAAIVINALAARSLKKQYETFNSTSKIRNIDCLFVGDMLKSSEYIEGGCSLAQLSAPGRGFLSDYEIIRHAHSILKDNGCIYIPYRIRHADSGLSLFDYPIFHRVTFEKYKCSHKAKRAKYPFFFAPLKTILFLLGPRKASGTLKSRCFPEIDKFCEERGYTVVYIEF